MKQLVILLTFITAALFSTAQKHIIAEASYINNKGYEISSAVMFSQKLHSGVGINASVIKMPGKDPAASLSLRGISETNFGLVINIQSGVVLNYDGKNGAYIKMGTGYSFGNIMLLASGQVLYNKLTWSAGIAIRF